MYDTLIIGLGCAGYTAAVYSARYKLDTFIVGAEEGGMGMSAAEVGNWPGDIDITGPDLMERFKQHAISFDNVTHKLARVEKVEQNDGVFTLKFDDGESVQGKTLIFALGSDKRKLGVPGEKELSVGKGVTYCATCDAPFYRGKDVAVIGGGDSAVEGAAIAAQFVNKLYLIHRRDQFRAEPYWVDKLKERDNVEMVLGHNVAEILGEERVTGIKLKEEYNGSDTIELSGVFIEIGSTPSTALPDQLGCEKDDRGFLKVDEGMRASVPGVFGAGDVTSGSNHFAQFATAAGEGSVAANSVFAYLQENGGHSGSMGG